MAAEYVKPVTNDVLRAFLVAHGKNPTADEDVSELASSVLLDLVRERSANRHKFVHNPEDLEFQRSIYKVVEEKLKTNPFKNASGAH